MNRQLEAVLKRLILVTAAVLLSASPALARVVRPGETLWSIAHANGLTPSRLALANGLSPHAHVIAGTTLRIPTTSTVGGGTAAPAPLGAYTVRAGDTLSALAARTGSSAAQIAWMNGIAPGSRLIAGTALKLPSTGPARVVTSATRVNGGTPYPTNRHVASAEIQSIARGGGVSGPLAAAIAWQESGFNNGAVSAANARGVMQVMPGTWDWVVHNLARSPLDPSSASDNVRAGVLYLRQLLRDTGGSAPTAIAAYYQGLGSVRSIGMLPQTRRYVASVLALRSRFGH